MKNYTTNHSIKFLALALTMSAMASVTLPSLATAKDVRCDVGLVQIDKKSGWGIGGESQDMTIVLQKNSSNFAGSETVTFKKNPYKVSVMVQVGEANMTNTWSTVAATLYKVTSGKNQLVGSVMIPNTYYSPGSIAPQEVYIGHNEVLDRVSNEPGVIDFKNLDFTKLGALFKDGEVIGAMITCTPN